jgi:hypothetical protein
MRLFILFFASFLSLFASAQTDSSYVTIEVETYVTCINFTSSRTVVSDFLFSNMIKIQSQQEDRSSMVVQFSLSEEQYRLFNDMIPTLGFVSSNNVNTTNNAQRVSELQLEIKYQNDKKESYEKILGQTEANSEQYYSYWNDLQQIKSEIFNLEKELLPYGRNTNMYKVLLNVREEITTPDHSRVAFVNMPGFEYSFLSVDVPKSGVSSASYQGYFLKYLFTKGKSFANIGVMKSDGNHSNDSTMFKDLFVFGFGQDFYSRHFGRGERRFLNLYSGYTVGGIIANSDTKKNTIFYVAPSVGIELIKTKYILLDTKVSYFVPTAFNHNLRGLSYSCAFNFVF